MLKSIQYYYNILDGNKPIRYTLKVLGLYQILHVVALDSGVKIGDNQHTLVTGNLFIQFLFLFSGAFCVVDNYIIAFLATFLFYFMKYGTSTSYNVTRTKNEIYDENKKKIV
jgi:hypothetical protein